MVSEKSYKLQNTAWVHQITRRHIITRGYVQKINYKYENKMN